jgi:hypothetical protein
MPAPRTKRLPDGTQVRVTFKGEGDHRPARVRGDLGKEATCPSCHKRAKHRYEPAGNKYRCESCGAKHYKGELKGSRNFRYDE